MMQRYCVTLRYVSKVYIDTQSKRDALDYAMGHELGVGSLELVEPKLADVKVVGYVNKDTNELMKKKKERRLNIDV